MNNLGRVLLQYGMHTRLTTIGAYMRSGPFPQTTPFPSPSSLLGLGSRLSTGRSGRQQRSKLVHKLF
jgi:hypothetical protein